jgi:hypothetical protein
LCPLHNQLQHDIFKRFRALKSSFLHALPAILVPPPEVRVREHPPLLPVPLHLVPAIAPVEQVNLRVPRGSALNSPIPQVLLPVHLENTVCSQGQRASQTLQGVYETGAVGVLSKSPTSIDYDA